VCGRSPLEHTGGQVEPLSPPCVGTVYQPATAPPGVTFPRATANGRGSRDSHDDRIEPCKALYLLGLDPIAESHARTATPTAFSAGTSLRPMPNGTDPHRAEPSPRSGIGFSRGDIKACSLTRSAMNGSWSTSPWTGRYLGKWFDKAGFPGESTPGSPNHGGNTSRRESSHPRLAKLDPGWDCNGFLADHFARDVESKQRMNKVQPWVRLCGNDFLITGTSKELLP